MAIPIAFLLASVSASLTAQVPCESFASGPFINVQTPPCEGSCGTPVVPGFEVFGNEAYLFNAIAGSQYTVDFCAGYLNGRWPAAITVALSDDAGGVVAGSTIASSAGCSLTFTTPATDTYVIIISVLDDCGGPNLPSGNGMLSVDCGPNGALCTPPPMACETFASGPFINIQTPPCEGSCGTPVEPGFEAFGNEAYLFNAIAGSQYTVDFCDGYLESRWSAVITVALSDDAGGAVPGSSIAFGPGCSLTFTTPATDTYVIIISVLGDCGGPNLPTGNGFLSADCGPNGALCTAPPLPCETFASGPFINIQTPPCEGSCGTPLEPGFEAFGNEAYLFNAIAGSQYTLDFCDGYLESRWAAGITVALSDDAGGAVPGSSIAWNPGCALTFTTPRTDTHVIILSVLNDCGGLNLPTGNGFLSVDCGPNGALCSNPFLIFLDGFETTNVMGLSGIASKANSCSAAADVRAISRRLASIPTATRMLQRQGDDGPPTPSASARAGREERASGADDGDAPLESIAPKPKDASGYRH